MIMMPETETAIYTIQKVIAEASRELNKPEYVDLLQWLQDHVSNLLKHEEQ